MKVAVADETVLETPPGPVTPRVPPDARPGDGVRPPEDGAPEPGGWRWIPDPAEDQVSAPAESGLWPGEALIRALAWGSLHSWG
jgi:hypothetical protein